MSARLPRSFYDRPAHEVAPDLLGRDLVRLEGSTVLRARIVETEAYDEGDPASHSHRGRTERNSSMFGPPGHLYVYLSYGIHWCANVVTGPVGNGSAVLIRGAVPLEGLAVMASRRGRGRARDLCSGPGKVCSSFAIEGSLDGMDLLRNDAGLRLEVGKTVALQAIRKGTRVGISRARDTLWRFSVDPERVTGSST